MDREQSLPGGGVRRRTVLRVLTSGSVLALLAACSAPASGPSSPAQSASTGTGGPATAATSVPASTASAPATATSTASAPATSAGTTSGSLSVTLADLGTENHDVIVSALNNVVPLVYEPLLQYDPQGNIVPWLAESWQMSADGKLWTFNIRKGVKWTNGDELTADDAKFTIERYISDAAKSPWSPSSRQTVDHIELPDRYTLQIYAKDPPYVFYPDALTGTLIVSRKYFDSVGSDGFSKAPVGTGPWRLTKFSASASAELEPNRDYWGHGVVWDRLNLLQVPEESTRIAMLKRAEADISVVSNDNAVNLRDADGFQLRQTRASTIPTLFMAGYWMQSGATSDARVREAMDLAINRQEIVDSFFKGFGKPGAGNTSMTEQHWGFDPIWYSITFDPARARQLLTEAGYPGKFADPVVRIFSTVQASAGWEPDLLQVISAYWGAVGIQTQLVPMDYTAMRTAWIAKDPKIMGGVAPFMSLGGGSAAGSIPGQQNHYTSRGVNSGGNDAQLDKDFSAMIAELDANKRLALWHTVQQESFALHSVLGVCQVYDQYAVSSKIGEWTGLDYINYPSSSIMALTGIQHR